jgi:magnesium chelatase family protein
LLSLETGVLLAAIHAARDGKGLICPAAQGTQATSTGEVEVPAAPDLLAILKGTILLAAPPPGEGNPADSGSGLVQVKEHQRAKRSLMIAWPTSTV